MEIRTTGNLTKSLPQEIRGRIATCVNTIIAPEVQLLHEQPELFTPHEIIYPLGPIDNTAWQKCLQSLGNPFNLLRLECFVNGDIQSLFYVKTSIDQLMRNEWDCYHTKVDDIGLPIGLKKESRGFVISDPEETLPLGLLNDIANFLAKSLESGPREGSKDEYKRRAELSNFKNQLLIGEMIADTDRFYGNFETNSTSINHCRLMTSGEAVSFIELLNNTAVRSRNLIPTYSGPVVGNSFNLARVYSNESNKNELNPDGLVLEVNVNLNHKFLGVANMTETYTLIPIHFRNGNRAAVIQQTSVNNNDPSDIYDPVIRTSNWLSYLLRYNL